MAQNIANTAWAFATLGQADAQLFMALAREAERRVGNFNGQDLANTAWAFAKAGQLDASLFAALAREAERRVGDFNAQHLANTAWAFAKAGQLDASLFAAVARAADGRVGDFDAPSICMTLWALSRHESLRDAWSLLEHAHCAGYSFSPLCFGALLMECEQRGLFEHEIALLQGLEATAGFKTAAKRVAYLQIAKIDEV